MFRRLVVAADGVGAAHQQVASLPCGYVAVTVVDHAYLVGLRQRSPLGGADDVVRIVETGEVEQAFRHAEHLLDLGAEDWADPAGQFRAEFRPAHLEQPQAGQVVVAPFRGVQPQCGQRRYECHDGDPLAR